MVVLRLWGSSQMPLAPACCRLPFSSKRNLTRAPCRTCHAPMLPAGTTLTATAHIITAVIGAGVLALPNAVAMLGWCAMLLPRLRFFECCHVPLCMVAGFFRRPQSQASR